MIQAAKIIGTGLATTGLIGAGVGIGVVFGVVNVISIFISSMIGFYLLFIGCFVATNIDFSYLLLLVKVILYNMTIGSINVVRFGSSYINIIAVPFLLIVTVWAYHEFIGFSVIHLASDVSPTSIHGLRISIAILHARRAHLEAAAHAEHANLMAIVRSGDRSPVNMTRLFNIANEEESVIAEIARLTTSLNSAIASLPE